MTSLHNVTNTNQNPNLKPPRNSQAISIATFDLRETLDSGQVFHWNEVEADGFEGCIGKQFVRVFQKGAELWVEPAEAVETGS